MTKIEAMIEVFKNKGNVIAVSENGNFINYGAGQSLRWNSTGEFVGCDYLENDGWIIQKSKKVNSHV